MERRIYKYGAGSNVVVLGDSLESLDQFYSDEEAASGGEILTCAYAMKQGEFKEVSAFASQLDNQLRKVKEKGNYSPTTLQ